MCNDDISCLSHKIQLINAPVHHLLHLDLQPLEPRVMQACSLLSLLCTGLYACGNVCNVGGDVGGKRTEGGEDVG